MCVLVFGHRVHPEYPLVFAGNRDEFYARKTSPLAQFKNHPKIYGGQDLEKGGTWTAITRDGYWGALTNFRDPGNQTTYSKSRGELIVRYLASESDPEDFIQNLPSGVADLYPGFNLLLGSNDKIVHWNNVLNQVNVLSPGIYTLSNHTLNTDWFKTRRLKNHFEPLLAKESVDPEELFSILYDLEYPQSDHQVQQTGLPFEIEKALSPVFISGIPEYGTRASTVILKNKKDVRIFERSFDSDGQEIISKEF